MKKIVLLLLPLLISLCWGCASTYGLTEEQQLQAIEKYPRGGLNIEPSDSVFMTTMKITGRVLICPLTFGISELALLEEREASFRKYADFLYYNSFLGKPCSAVIQCCPQLGHSNFISAIGFSLKRANDFFYSHKEMEMANYCLHSLM